MDTPLWSAIMFQMLLNPAVLARLSFAILVAASLHAEASVAPAPMRSPVRSNVPLVKPQALARETIPQKIRVRLAEAIPMVALAGYDLRISELTGGRDRRLAGTPDRRSQWELRCHGDRVRAVPVAGAAYDRGVKPLDLQSPAVVHSESGFLHFRERPYREELRVYAVGSLCEVVNEVDLEKYLDGLVNSEFSARWGEEAIAAQVIAARTYALHQMMQSRDEHFDVDATVRDQVYDGSIKEDYRASRSVERTRGLVLSTSDGKPIKAFYHSTCGGRTELPQQVWSASYPGFRRSVSCAFCANSPVIHWKMDVEQEELLDAVRRGARSAGQLKGWPKEWLSAVRDGKLLDLRVAGTDSAGRVSKLLLSFAVKGTSRALELPVSGAMFRDWLGPAKFRSAAFQVTGHRAALSGVVGRRWRFEGRGNGHGVGMCQYGAKGMAERGFKMAGILGHYYPDAILKKLW